MFDTILLKTLFRISSTDPKVSKIAISVELISRNLLF